MNILRPIFFIILIALLSGCVTKVVYTVDSETQMRHKQVGILSKQLVAYKVRIIQDKENMVLVLPSKILFNPNSANLTHRAYEILDLVLDLTGYYDESVISVTGFYRINPKPEGLIVERAHKVVQYLWKAGVGASFMYATKSDTLFANCVVIKFRKF